MKKQVAILLLTLCLLVTGCSRAGTLMPRPQEPEPTAVYDWMDGESPVPAKRMGITRVGMTHIPQTVSAKGIYFLERSPLTEDSYLLYTDHGSSDVVKLCGRIDCSHDSSDCNAYIFAGNSLSYHGGYLYVLSGDSSEKACELIRMAPDGSDHVVVLDLLGFAKKCGGSYVANSFISDGILFIFVYYWEETIDGLTIHRTGKQLDSYYYKLDGSMDTPEPHRSIDMLYSCGDTLLCYSPAKEQNGGTSGSYWSWDPNTNTTTYLTDSPGQPGYFDGNAGYFFQNGGIWRRTYATQQDELLVDTGLEGDYVLFVFSDCLMVVSRKHEVPDKNLYFYNWAFELVDTVTLNYDYSRWTNLLLVSETAEQIILTNDDRQLPLYYINKSELGTGNVTIHTFKYA